VARRNKLSRFADMQKYPHVFEPDKDILLNEDYSMKGKWRSDFFRNDNPITLELGCGRGEYTVGLASRYAQRNFLGVDVKGARMWKGATYALNTGMTNVGFVRSRIEFISRIFSPGEVGEIWVTFPDPQPKKASKRLIHSSFLNDYKKILGKGGVVHLKTDSRLLYEYLQVILSFNQIEPEFASPDLYLQDHESEAAILKTRYEEIFLKEGKPITYTRFRMDFTRDIQEPDYFDGSKWI
jgi:tRNA (guanine-N7-)-methyltransferase